MHPGFKRAIGYPTASEKGVITGIYYLGTWVSYIFISHPVSDRLGRRYAALLGIIIVAIAIAFESGASGPGAFSMVIVGRIISGLGIGMVSTSVPLYQRSALPVLKTFSLFLFKRPRHARMHDITPDSHLQAEETPYRLSC